jgi:META domain
MLSRAAAILAFALTACDGPIPMPSGAVKDADAYATLLEAGGAASPLKGAIIGGEWIFDSPGAAGWSAVTLPPPEIAAGRRRYQLKHAELTIEPGGCADAKLRPELADRVLFIAESAEFSGCGGPRQSSANVAGTHWQVLRLGAVPAPEQAGPTIFSFGKDGGIGGTLACNDVSIGTRWTQERFLQPDGAEQFVEATLVGCEGPAVDFGRLFWSAMPRAVWWRRDGDRLRIVLADRSEAELRLIL